MSCFTCGVYATIYRSKPCQPRHSSCVTLHVASNSTTLELSLIDLSSHQSNPGFHADLLIFSIEGQPDNFVDGKITCSLFSLGSIKVVVVVPQHCLSSWPHSFVDVKLPSQSSDGNTGSTLRRFGPTLRLRVSTLTSFQCFGRLSVSPF